MDPFLGTIIMFGGNFAPRGWGLCDGQLLPISSNTALFSILGTTYGGDGRTTFGLPDLRGRVPLHPGNGAGLTQKKLGQKGGTEEVTLVQSQMPKHTHSPRLHAETALAIEGNPTGNMLGLVGGANVTNIYAPFDAADNIEMSHESITSTSVGGDQAHTNEQPYQCVNFIIALEGIFPSRS